MSRLLPVLIPLLVLVGCRPPAYVQPAENEPHAVLKIRHVVHAQRGPHYGAATMLGEFAIDERTLTPEQDAANTIHLRVRPEVATFVIRGSSFHYEQRAVQRSRQVPESYSCSQQQCSYSYPSGNSCRTVMSTCTRYRTEYYTEMQTVTVVDDACGRQLPLAPRAGGSYLVQFDYLGENQCEMRCYEQLPGLDGTYQLVPCTAPPVVTAGR